MSTHSQNTIRILVVDDHTLFRRGLTALLARDPQLGLKLLAAVSLAANLLMLWLLLIR